MDNPTTVAEIASFLNLTVESVTIDEIFDELRPESVTRELDRLKSQGQLETSGYHEDSHWYQSHLGDGETGKWKLRLPVEEQQAVMGAVGSDLLEPVPPYSIDWSAKLFNYFDERPGYAHEVFDCDGEERLLIWGPYQHLRTGRWQVTPRLNIEELQDPISIRVEIYIPITGREVLALRVVNLPTSTPERMVMEFDHHDHLEPVELRVSSMSDRRKGRVGFSGAELKWLGPSERASRLAARPVSDSRCRDNSVSLPLSC